MKKVLVCMMILLVGFSVCQADEPQKFSPEKFQAEMEQFITKEAGLSADESAKFFPLFREMQQKQRAVFGKMRQEGRVKPTDDASCKRLVQKRDEVELELKEHYYYLKEVELELKDYYYYLLKEDLGLMEH